MAFCGKCFHVDFLFGLLAQMGGSAFCSIPKSSVALTTSPCRAKALSAACLRATKI
jgi:hypothetical protein